MASPGSKAAISATPARKTFAAATADEEDASVGSAASGGSMLLDLGTSPRRWLLLAIMFANNMHSDWTCFSLAPVADVAEEWYAGLHSDRLLEAFFLANIIAALFEPWIVGRFGLRNGILFGTGLSMIGSFVKGGVPGLATNEQASLVYLGFVLCGIGQPLLQITALEFVSNYFPMEERSLATMLYVNSNQLGVGLAFAMGPLIVGGEASGLVTLNHAMAWLSLLLFGFVWGFLESRPSLPPSKSAATSWANPPPARSILGHLTCATALLRIPNFAMTLIAFALSAGTSNVVSTFLQDIVEEEQQRPNDALAGAIGAAFQGMIMVGSTVVGVIVDRRHAYKQINVYLYGLSIACAVALAGVLQAKRGLPGLWVSILLLGAVSGPLKPLSADLGVEVAFPADENHCLLVQFLAANIFSYFIILLSSTFPNPALAGMYMLIVLLFGGAGIFWLRFTEKYHRINIDRCENLL